MTRCPVRWNRSSVSAFILAAFIAASPAIGAAESTPVGNVATSRVAIDNFGRVSETYFRGAQPEGADFSTLAAFGIKTVIDLQADGIAAEEQMVEGAGMAFHRIPMTTHVAPTGEQLAQFLDIVNDPANQPVYVHCAGGRHRTGVMTAVYRMTHDGWDAARAFKEMKNYKFGADFLHAEFKQFVYAFRPEPTPTELVRAGTADEVNVLADERR